MATTTNKQAQGTLTDISVSSFQSIANTTAITLTTAIDFSTLGSYAGTFEYSSSGFGSAPSAGGTIDLYWIPAVDGTNYATASTTQLAPVFICSIPLAANTSAQRVARPVLVPFPVLCKVYAVNSSGQTTPSDAKIKFLPHTDTNS